ncbi:MAG: hypothetical protein V4681_03545 [Patescibacteria group bacterium]
MSFLKSWAVFLAAGGMMASQIWLVLATLGDEPTAKFLSYFVNWFATGTFLAFFASHLMDDHVRSHAGRTAACFGLAAAIASVFMIGLRHTGESVPVWTGIAIVFFDALCLGILALTLLTVQNDYELGTEDDAAHAP